MSTLFGNDLAVQYVHTHLDHDYPAGSVLALVTWTPQEDARWFGGRIPAAAKSVEFVQVAAGADHHPSYSYQRFEGAPLKKVAEQECPTPTEQIGDLLSQRPSLLP